MRIEVLYFEGCPHHQETVERTRDVLAETGVRAEVREICVRDSEEASSLCFLGSPTVRVNGVDVEPGAAAQGDVGLSCRRYGSSGVPPRELLAAAIGSARHGALPARRRVAAAFAVPAAGLAALPACPACYPLYAGVLSSLGLTALADPGTQQALTAVLLAVALGALALRSRTRRAYAPLALGVVGTALLVAGKFFLISTLLAYAGAAALIAAAVWSAWPGGGRASRCEACAAALRREPVSTIESADAPRP